MGIVWGDVSMADRTRFGSVGQIGISSLPQENNKHSLTHSLSLSPSLSLSLSLSQENNKRSLDSFISLSLSHTCSCLATCTATYYYALSRVASTFGYRVRDLFESTTVFAEKTVNKLSLLIYRRLSVVVCPFMFV